MRKRCRLIITRRQSSVGRDVHTHVWTSCNVKQPKGVIRMASSLSTERAEFLRMLEELERLYAGLPGDHAGVSNQGLRKLQELRARVDGAPSPAKLHQAWRDAQPILSAAAAELLRLWLGTLLNCLSIAVGWRVGLYDNRRMHQVVASSSWLHAGRVRSTFGHLSINVVAG